MTEAEKSLLEDAAKACGKSKCGEFNMLKCCRAAAHAGSCCFVIDHENDYLHNKIRRHASVQVAAGLQRGRKG